MEIADKIRKLREEHGWSQEKVAESLGITSNGYAKIERGETKINIRRLEELAELFGVDVLELVNADNKHVIFFSNENSESVVLGGNYGTINGTDVLQVMQKVILQKDEIIRQKDETIRQKDEIIKQMQMNKQ